MKIKNSNFNLKQIANSGQCFRWKKLSDNIYLIPAFGKEIIIIQDNDNIDLLCSDEDFELIWKDYFDLNRDYSLLGKKINSSDDTHLKESFLSGSGIRILKQDLWEMIFSFMISQNNNIKRISKSIEMICEHVGLQSENYFNIVNSVEYKDLLEKDSIDLLNCLSYRFPNADEIPPELFDDPSLGLGYRAPYLKGLLEYVLSNPSWINELRNMNYDDAFNSLINIKGIGTKVANCICLFGLNHLDSFPIDTHVKQLLEKYYPEGIDLSLYKSEAGIIQQYLFYYELINK